MVVFAISVELRWWEAVVEVGLMAEVYSGLLKMADPDHASQPRPLPNSSSFAMAQVPVAAELADQESFSLANPRCWHWLPIVEYNRACCSSHSLIWRVLIVIGTRLSLVVAVEHSGGLALPAA